ncbi:DNA polymerase III subunit beta [Rothia sp. P7181]|uniref:DNA polymerase III subunit beta n=1 Tax=unclassified Rothia (in: high G+C Gram-positive bacteria) TaxID=2689056 RepID=UPI003AE632CC
MKFTIERDVLTEAVGWTARSLSPRPPAPVLSGLLITAAEGEVSIASFDYETSAKLNVSATIEEEGVALVSGRLLAEICRSLPNADVNVSVHDSKMHIQCRTASFNLSTMPVADYPELPTLPTISGTVEGNSFAKAVSQVVVAASKDDTLPILTAILVEIEGEKMTLLATDRYRLAMRELTWAPTSSDIQTAVLVKAKTMSEVAKTLGGAGELNIALSDSHELIGFESGGRRTTSLLVDGEYPKIRSLFPDSTPIHAIVRTSDLLEAVRRVSLVAERNTPVRLVFSEGQVTLDAGTGEDAQATETLSAHLEGEESITVAFNPSYLSEGLNSFGTEFIRFSFTDPAKPASISGQKELMGEDESDYRYLLMPVRLPN